MLWCTVTAVVSCCSMCCHWGNHSVILMSVFVFLYQNLMYTFQVCSTGHTFSCSISFFRPWWRTRKNGDCRTGWPSLLCSNTVPPRISVQTFEAITSILWTDFGFSWKTAFICVSWLSTVSKAAVRCWVR